MLLKSSGIPARIGPAVVFLLAVVIWETAFRLHWWSHRLFPGPQEVGQAFIHGVRDGSLIAGIQLSLVRVGIAFILALGAGFLLGLLSGASGVLARTIGAVSLGLQALPSICWLPLA